MRAFGAAVLSISMIASLSCASSSKDVSQMSSAPHTGIGSGGNNVVYHLPEGWRQRPVTEGEKGYFEFLDYRDKERISFLVLHVTVERMGPDRLADHERDLRELETASFEKLSEHTRRFGPCAKIAPSPSVNANRGVVWLPECRHVSTWKKDGALETVHMVRRVAYRRIGDANLHSLLFLASWPLEQEAEISKDFKAIVTKTHLE